MNNSKKTAVFVGVLYILGTLAGNGDSGLVDS